MGLLDDDNGLINGGHEHWSSVQIFLLACDMFLIHGGRLYIMPPGLAEGYGQSLR